MGSYKNPAGHERIWNIISLSLSLLFITSVEKPRVVFFSPSGLQAHAHTLKTKTHMLKQKPPQFAVEHTSQFASVDLLDKCHITEERERGRNLASHQTSIMIPKILNTLLCAASSLYPLPSACLTWFLYLFLYPSCYPSFCALCLSCLVFSPITWARAVLWGIWPLFFKSRKPQFV